jgi:hypothetical protein
MSLPSALSSALEAARAIAAELRLPRSDAAELDLTIRQIEAMGKLTRNELLHIEQVLPEASSLLREFVTP